MLPSELWLGDEQEVASVTWLRRLRACALALALLLRLKEGLGVPRPLLLSAKLSERDTEEASLAVEVASVVAREVAAVAVVVVAARSPDNMTSCCFAAVTVTTTWCLVSS